jgi:hypothetical protein
MILVVKHIRSRCACQAKQDLIAQRNGLRAIGSVTIASTSGPARPVTPRRPRIEPRGVVDFRGILDA